MPTRSYTLSLTPAERLAKAGIKYDRADRMANRVSHDDYYGQFVTPYIKSLVLRAFSFEELTTSECPHFNDLPLHRWDRATGMLEGVGMLYVLACSGAATMAGNKPCISLSEKVCLLKEAARQIRGEAKP